MARVFQTRRARQDLEVIWLYIAQNNLSAADAWLDQLEIKLQTLAQDPRLGRLRLDLLPQAIPDLRSLPYGAYVIFYQPRPDGIDLIRVLHSARDIGPALLNEQD